MKSIFKAVLKDAATEQGRAGEEQEAEEQEERDLPKLKVWAPVWKLFSS